MWLCTAYQSKYCNNYNFLEARVRLQLIFLVSSMVVLLPRGWQKSQWIILTLSDMGRKTHVYPIPYGGWRHLTSLTLSPRGCRFRPTAEGVVLGPMLLFISWIYLKIEPTCKKIDKNIKNWARFQDFNILRNWDFTQPWLTEIAITRSNLEI